MDELKRPLKRAAVLLTIAAVFSVMTLLLLMAGTDASRGVILFQTLAATLMLIVAVVSWRTYILSERRKKEE